MDSDMRALEREALLGDARSAARLVVERARTRGEPAKRLRSLLLAANRHARIMLDNPSNTVAELVRELLDRDRLVDGQGWKDRLGFEHSFAADDRHGKTYVGAWRDDLIGVVTVGVTRVPQAEQPDLSYFRGVHLVRTVAWPELVRDERFVERARAWALADAEDRVVFTRDQARKFAPPARAKRENCRLCGGTGKLEESPCWNCNGTGRAPIRAERTPSSEEPRRRDRR